MKKKIIALSIILSLATAVLIVCILFLMDAIFSGCDQNESEVTNGGHLTANQTSSFGFTTTEPVESDFNPSKEPDTTPIYFDTPEEAAVGTLKAILENDRDMFKRYAHKSDSKLGEIREDFLKHLRNAEVEDYRRDYVFEDFTPYIWNEGRFYTLDGDSRQYNFYTADFQVTISIRVEYDIAEDRFYIDTAGVYGEKKTEYTELGEKYVEMRFTADNTSLEYVE